MSRLRDSSAGVGDGSDTLEEGGGHSASPQRGRSLSPMPRRTQRTVALDGKVRRPHSNTHMHTHTPSLSLSMSVCVVVLSLQSPWTLHNLASPPTLHMCAFVSVYAYTCACVYTCVCVRCGCGWGVQTLEEVLEQVMRSREALLDQPGKRVEAVRFSERIVQLQKVCVSAFQDCAPCLGNA